MDRYHDSTYAGCVLTCAILLALSHRRPPPPKGSRPPVDFVTSNPYLMALSACGPMLSLAPAVGVIAFVSSGFSVSSPLPLKFCPRPANVNPTIVTFNKTAVIVLLCTFSGSILRYVAKAQLGSSFTYELARPAGGLKQDGLYRYMQHPSYTGAFIANSAFVPFFWRFDGPLGCWMPAWMARSHVLNSIYLPFLVSLCIWVLYKRIPEEEAMMKKEFGKQWMEYHRRTTRFIPGVF